MRYPLLHSLTMYFFVFQPVFFLQLYSSRFLITCPYHLSLPLPMTVVIGSAPTSLLNSSCVLLSFMEIRHIHLIICISALSNYNPITARQGLVYDNGKLYGNGSNRDQQANRIHPFMISSIPSPNKDVLSLVPVQKMTVHDLYTITLEVIKNKCCYRGFENCGYYIR